MIQIYINNEEVLCDNVLEITEEMLNTSSTILNNCYPKSWENDHDYTSRFYYPQDYSMCKIYKDNELIFAGVVKNTGNVSLKPEDPKYCSLQILDFKTLLSEGETLDFVINNKTIPEAINQIIDAISDYGFVVGNINILNPDDIIGAYSTLDKTAYDVFQYLADISQSKWTTRMLNENSVAIDFYDPTLMPRGKDIEYTKEWFEENEIIDLKFNYNTRDYRNKQTMTSKEVYANIDYTESKISDGYSGTFTTQGNIGYILSINVDGVEKTFATEEEKKVGIEADFYYKPGNNNFYTNGTIYPTGETIIITYNPLVIGRQIIYNNVEVNRITNKINRKGIISRYENRNDILRSEELQKVGESYIKFKGKAEITLTIQTLSNIWNIGDVTAFDAPISDLVNDYMVKKKTTKIIPSVDKIFYTYELSNNFNSENAINYFDNQRAKANGNIAEGESISRNIDIDNTALIIFQNLTIEEVVVGNDNILNSVLESPFNN